MLVNISSFIGDPPADPLNNLPLDVLCFMEKLNSFIFGTFNVTNIFLLLPLSVSILILFHGDKRRQKGSTPSAAPISHSDVLTYHVVIIEMMGVTGCILNLCAVCTLQNEILMAGVFLFTFTYVGEVFFHILTCLECYLAAVHPIIYLILKQQRGIRIRNICISCSWLLTSVITGLLIEEKLFMAMNFLLIISSLIIVSFCSLSVLCVLIRPGPGKQGGDRKRVDQSKQKAFYTIMAILAVLLLRFVWDLIWAVLFTSRNDLTCVLITCNLWLKLPSSLLLPMMFLHKAGKLVCCHKRGGGTSEQ